MNRKQMITVFSAVFLTMLIVSLGSVFAGRVFREKNAQNAQEARTVVIPGRDDTTGAAAVENGTYEAAGHNAGAEITSMVILSEPDIYGEDDRTDTGPGSDARTVERPDGENGAESGSDAFGNTGGTEEAAGTNGGGTEKAGGNGDAGEAAGYAAEGAEETPVSVDGTREGGEEAPLSGEDRMQEAEVPAAEADVRIFFIGDSRTIDMFADSDAPLEGEMHDGILVYAMHGHGFPYLNQLLDNLQPDADDIVVTWMGANDDGNFAMYQERYETLLQSGTRLIVCTVGPTASGSIAYWDYPRYLNSRMANFNFGLVRWAEKREVPVIDLYGFVADNIRIDPDGIHYLPRPTTAIWNYVTEQLDGMGVPRAGNIP